MNLSDTSPDLDRMPGTTGPGSLLQSARIDRGLSIEDIANRMHLSNSIILSIEKNDFDAITAPIFVKGYLRAYARIVLLDEDEMIAQYVEAFSVDDPTLNTTSSMAAEITADDARIKWTTFLVIFVLVVLLGIWWWNKNQDRADVFSLDALQTDTMTQFDAAEDTLPGEIGAASEITASTANETFNAQSIDVESESSTSVEAAVAAAEDSGSEQLLNEDIPQEQIVGLEIAEDSGLISRLAPTGSDQLFITVHADSWADIKDSNGHQLVYDLLRAGQEVEITGKGPFAVFLGNGHGIELTYNNDLVDLTSRIRDDNTARLRIGS